MEQKLTGTLLYGKFGLEYLEGVSPAETNGAEKEPEFKAPAPRYTYSKGPVTSASWCADGSHFVFLSGKTECTVVRVGDGSMLAPKATTYNLLDGPDSAVSPVQVLQHTKISDKGSFLVTFQIRDANIQRKLSMKGNVKVTSLKTGREVLRRSVGNGPLKRTAITISPEEDFAVVIREKGGVDVHKITGNGFAPPQELCTARATAVSISPRHPVSGHQYIALGVPSKGAEPGTVLIYDEDFKLVAKRISYNVDSWKLDWSPRASCCLIQATSEVDATGQSYYGASTLYIFNASAKSISEPSIPDMKTGDRCVAAVWSPSTKREQAVVIFGSIPSHAVLLDHTGTARFDFGTSFANSIVWAPHGRYVALGAFGAANGGVVVWDTNRKAPVGRFEAPNTAQHGWLADSRALFAATTTPRMRVDNAFKFLRPDGTVYFTREYEVLYGVQTRPAPGQFEDRPMSPHRLQRALQTASKPKAKGVWVPPHKRGKAGSSAVIGGGVLGGAKLEAPKELAVTTTVDTTGMSKSARRRLRKKLSNQ